jgi:hypothetical protein
VNLPFWRIKPCECSVNPHTNPAVVAADVIKLTYIGIIKIAHIRMLIEVYKKFPVSDN